jgi:hypothetical protein
MAKTEDTIVEEVAPELTVVEEAPVVDVALKYEELLNFLKPLMPHEMLVAFAAKKKELFG